MSRGFITSPLRGWICIVDFCGNWSGGPVLPTQYNVAAWWSPSRKLTKFLGYWEGVQPMPSETKPDENMCERWVEKDPGHWGRRIRAHYRREAEREERNKAISDRYEKNGVNYGLVRWRTKDGQEHQQEGIVGIRTELDLLSGLVKALGDKYPGAVLTKLAVERNVPRKVAEKRIETARIKNAQKPPA